LYPKSQIDVHVMVLEDAGSVLAAALTCAGLALADASIHMFDILIGASLVGAQRITSIKLDKKYYNN
jgi:exosome complex component MTR3